MFLKNKSLINSHNSPYLFNFICVSYSALQIFKNLNVQIKNNKKTNKQTNKKAIYPKQMSSLLQKITSFLKYMYNLPFTLLIRLNKIKSFLLLFKYADTKLLSPSLMNNFFDFYFESHPEVCQLVFSSLLLDRTAAIVDRKVFKKFFEKSEKTGNYDFLHFIMQHLEHQENKEHLIWHVHKYFLKLAVRNNDFDDLAISLKKAQKFCSNKNYKTMLGFFEESIKKGVSTNDFELSIKFLNLLKEMEIFPADTFFNKLIDFASKKERINFSEAVYQTMLDLKITPTIVTYNTLISCYFKNGDTEKAWQIFDNIKNFPLIKADNFTYTTMIKGVKMNERPNLELAFKLFEEYRKDNAADQIIYNCMLDVCIICGDFVKAKSLLDSMKQNPSIKCDEITYNTLIKGCGRTHSTSQAKQFFKEMKEIGLAPNRITYNSLIDCCVKNNDMHAAWQYYEEMLNASLQPDNFTYSILINGIKSNKTNKELFVKSVSLLEAIKNRFEPDEILYNSLIDACSKFNEENKALYLFEEMKMKGIEPSSVTYGILIKIFGKMNDLVRAFKIFERIKSENLKINDVTYGCLLDACVKNNRLDLALLLFDRIKNDNIELNTILYTTLIKGLSKACKVAEASELFSLMKKNSKTYPNLITYNCMIDAYVRINDINKANSTFFELESEKKIKPDLISYSTLIKGFCKTGDVEKIYFFFEKMIKKNIIADEPLVNVCMEACFNGKKSDLGIRIFDRVIGMEFNPSAVTFSIAIKLFGAVRKFTRAWETLELMKKYEVEPGIIIYTNLIQVCFHVKKIENVMELYRKIKNEKIQIDQICYTRLINGSLSLNDLEKACHFFEDSHTNKINLKKETCENLMEALENSNFNEKDRILNILKTLIDKDSRYLREKTNENVEQQERKSISFNSNANKKINYQSKPQKENKENFMDFRNKPKTNEKTAYKKEDMVLRPRILNPKNL